MFIIASGSLRQTQDRGGARLQSIQTPIPHSHVASDTPAGRQSFVFTRISASDRAGPALAGDARLIGKVSRRLRQSVASHSAYPRRMSVASIRSFEGSA